MVTLDDDAAMEAANALRQRAVAADAYGGTEERARAKKLRLIIADIEKQLGVDNDNANT